MKLSKTKREELRNRFGGCCAFCGTTLPVRGWHADFVGADYVSDGLFAICTDCRTSKGAATPEAFRVLLSEQVAKAQRHSVNFRTALRFGLISEKADPILFWFEKYQVEHHIDLLHCSAA